MIATRKPLATVSGLTDALKLPRRAHEPDQDMPFLTLTSHDLGGTGGDDWIAASLQLRGRPICGKPR